MKVITISKKKFDSLEPLELEPKVRNTEAKMYNYSHQGKRKVLKELYVSNGEMFGSKI